MAILREINLRPIASIYTRARGVDIATSFRGRTRGATLRLALWLMLLFYQF